MALASGWPFFSETIFVSALKARLNILSLALSWTLWCCLCCAYVIFNRIEPRLKYVISVLTPCPRRIRHSVARGEGGGGGVDTPRSQVSRMLTAAATRRWLYFRPAGAETTAEKYLFSDNGQKNLFWHHICYCDFRHRIFKTHLSKFTHNNQGLF